MPKILFILFLILITIHASAQMDGFYVGINICGPEFGERNIPGNLQVDYVYPLDSEVEYFASKGFPVLSLPVKWERIQHTLNGDLDSAEMNELKAFIIKCNAYDEKVIITLQNFGRYHLDNKDLVLGKKLPPECLADVWKKIAHEFCGISNIYGFDIMNEPYDIKPKIWLESAQKTILAIREIDSSVAIIVDGLDYAYSADWASMNDKLKNLKDPLNNLIYDAHCYFDDDHSGKYEKRNNRHADADIGVSRAAPFVKWLEKNKKKGMIGEFGVPYDEPKWFVVMDNFLKFMDKHHVPVKYWAAGQWWNDYNLSIEPQNGRDKPQMAIIEKYVRKNETF